MSGEEEEDEEELDEESEEQVVKKAKRGRPSKAESNLRAQRGRKPTSRVGSRGASA
jgi:hypothetical protein